MASVRHPTPTIELVHTASQRLVRTVDSLDDDAWASPSLLPGWSVAHAVAHLALNAEGLAGALVGIAEGEEVTMYRSEQARDADIESLGAAGPATIRDHLFAGVTRFEAAVAALPLEREGALITRTPGSAMTFVAGAVPWMRLREVEIHHADLGTGYSPADWPEEFTLRLLEHRAGQWSGPGCTATAADLGRSWELGTPGPTVTASASELAWWITGRPAFPGTSGPACDGGALPEVGAM
jgi:maleylpyruvate isomerase